MTDKRVPLDQVKVVIFFLIQQFQGKMAELWRYLNLPSKPDSKKRGALTGRDGPAP